MAATTAAVRALKRTTPIVPIVFVGVIDPVGSGLVASLARAGGNATGFTLFEYAIAAKWLELVKEIAPGVTQVAVLRDPAIAARPSIKKPTNPRSISETDIRLSERRQLKFF